MAEINMIPLIDVMLVLLVIFIVTAPLLVHGVKVDLPTASSKPIVSNTAVIELTIGAAGELYFDGIEVTREALAQRLAGAGTVHPQPALHLRADRATPYQAIAETMAIVARAGIAHIGFVAHPEASAPARFRRQSSTMTH